MAKKNGFLSVNGADLREFFMAIYRRLCADLMTALIGPHQPVVSHQGEVC